MDMDDRVLFDVDVRLTRIKTGEVRPYKAQFVDSLDNAWIWDEGNFGCNCNRALFWVSDHDAEEVETHLDEAEADCCEPLAFTVDIFYEGKLIYSDDPAWRLANGY